MTSGLLDSPPGLNAVQQSLKDALDHSGTQIASGSQLVSGRANDWRAARPVQVGACGASLVLRHPRDMRVPSQAIAFRLPLCSEEPRPLSRFRSMFR